MVIFDTQLGAVAMAGGGNIAYARCPRVFFYKKQKSEKRGAAQGCARGSLAPRLIPLRLGMSFSWR